MENFEVKTLRPGVVTEIINCNAGNGKNIIGFYDHQEDKIMSDEPAIIIFSSYGKMKSYDSLSLSHRLVEEGFGVIRYDYTDTTENYGNMNFDTTPRNIKDELTYILDFAKYKFGIEEFGVITGDSEIETTIRDMVREGRIKFFLNKEVYKKETVDSEPDKRRSFRLPKLLPINLKVKKSGIILGEYEVIGRNICEGGVFIETSIRKLLLNLRSGNSRIELTIEFPERKKQLKTMANVAWLKEESASGEGKCEIGMRFIALSDEDKSQVSSYISEESKKQEKERKIWFPIQIEVSAIVKRDKDVVYHLLKDMGRFPEFMKNVKRIDILDEKRDKLVTEWEIDVEGTSIIWKEEDIFDDKNMALKFKMLEGDFNKYEGNWSLFSLLKGTEVKLSVVVDWGMPNWEKYARDILKEKMESTLRKMLDGIRQKMWVEKVDKLVKFACIIHPLDINLVFPFEENLKYKRESLVEKIFEWTPGFHCSYITDIRSLTGKEITGELIGCNLLPNQMLNMDSDFVLDRIVESGKIAEKRGAKIFGLAAYAAVVGNHGIEVAKRLTIPVTTGAHYTIVSMISSILKVAERRKISLPQAKIAIVGATTSIGRICAKTFSTCASRLFLIAKSQEKLNELTDFLLKSPTYAEIEKAQEIKSEILSEADIIIITSCSLAKLIDFRFLKLGAVIYDATFPKSIFNKDVKLRSDIFVMDGGIVSPPGDVKFNFYFGLPPGLMYPCLAEPMILAFEEKYESYSLGTEIDPVKLKEISKLASKHGFELTHFISSGRVIPIENVKPVRVAI